MYSVVIPLFNHRHYVEHAIRSVQRQSVPAREIIVIDDGSTDDSVKVVAQMAVDDRRIKFWQQPNRGAHFTINAGLHRATSEVLAILNSDDIYEPGRLEVCLQRLSMEPSVDGVATGLSCIDNTGRLVNNPWYEQALGEGMRDDDMAMALLNANFLVTTSNLVVRRAVFDRIGYFSPLRYAHDLEFFTRMLRADLKIGFIREPHLKYRTHASNTINENHHKVRVEWAAIIAWHMNRLLDSGGDLTRQMAKVSRALHIARVNNLYTLVQWMTWVCEYASRSGSNPFELPDWSRFAEAALALDE